MIAPSRLNTTAFMWQRRQGFPMTNHNPVFTSSNATGSFNEFANTSNSTAAHTLSGTMNFQDSDRSDSHTTSATLQSAVLSSGSIIPASSLSHFQTAMTSQILADSNGSGKLKWSFSDIDDDFDFLAKNQNLVLTYNIRVYDNHGGSALRTVKVTVTGTDDKPVFAMEAVATVTEQENKTLSLSSDTVQIALGFTDEDLTNTGHTASVTGVSASGNTSGLLPGSFGDAVLMSFFHVNNVVKASGSSTGTINTTFSAPDLAFDYLSAGETLGITYAVRLDDRAGGISTQTVVVTVVGTNDKPIYLSGPEFAHLVEDENVSPAGNLTADGDLLFADIDLHDTHDVSTTVTASRSGGGSVPISDATFLAAFSVAVDPDSTNHLLGELDWEFALQNSAASFLNSGETLTLVYHVTIIDSAGATATQDVTVTILGTNEPVIITSGPQSGAVTELADTTGSAAIDSTAGALNFTDADTNDTHTVSTTLVSTSGGDVPAGAQASLATALGTVLNDSTGTGSGTIDWTFAIADGDLDFLSEGQQLTVNYDVTVSDGSTTSTQSVSVVVTGANDAVAVTGGPQSGSVSEQAGVTGSTSLDSTSPVPTGTVAFSDVDLNDTHTVSVAVNSAMWSSGGIVPDATLAELQAALLTSLSDSTGTGSGGVDWSFAIQDKFLDFLSAGETLTITYDVIVSDGITTSTQQVTVTATGAEDPLTVNAATGTGFDSAGIDTDNIIAVGNAITDAGDTGGDQSVTLSVTDVNGSAANVGNFVAGAYGNLILFEDGTYLYQANANVDPLQDGDSVTDVFNFTVTDSLGRTETTTLTINVLGMDDAPVVTSASALGTITEDAGPTVGVNGDFETGDLSGWSSNGVTASGHFLGGQLGNYGARADGFGFLEQAAVTTAGQHYTLSFYVAGDSEGNATTLSVYWDGVQILAVSNASPGFTQYTFDVVGDALDPTTQLFFDFGGSGAQFIDQVSISPTPGPATEEAIGSIAFSDVETADTHTASFVPQGSGYVGIFSLDPVAEGGGTGSIGWHFTVDDADIQFLAQGQTLTQVYTVTIMDDHGQLTQRDVAVALNGANDAPTAVDETIVSDAGADGVIQIPAWALALNDSDPDTIDHLFVNGIVSSTGGDAVPFGDVFFVDDTTAGGSFTYTTSDGIVTSGNAATATVVNNPTSATDLTGTGGDDIIIATNGTETLDGGDGDDVLIGNSGSHTMTGGAGDDAFAFLSTSDGPGIITDFTTAEDRIVISANGFGGGLTAGMDVSSLFETSGDDQFSGSGAVFHFDNANQTLYFSADGTQASAITVATLQAGATLNAHDLLIV
jgi:VCBS repeat-containing protein